MERIAEWYEDIEDLVLIESKLPVPVNAQSLEKAWQQDLAGELGRHTITTGMPIRSNPVTLAMRVIPIAGINGITVASVYAGSTSKCAPI